MPIVRSVNIRSNAVAGWSRLAAAFDGWSRRQLAGEALRCAAVALSAAAVQAAQGGSWPVVLAAGTVVAVLTVLRRVLPATVLVVAGAVCGVNTRVGGVALMMAAWSAGRRTVGTARAFATFGAGFACLLASAVVVHRGQYGIPAALFFGALSFLAQAVLPGLATRYWSQRRTLLRVLQENNAQLLRERGWTVEQARMRERQRIARDMHDSLGHHLTLIAVQAGALEVAPELTGERREAAAVLRRATVAALQELRVVVGVLAADGEGADGGAPGGAGSADADADAGAGSEGAAGGSAAGEWSGARGTAGIADLVAAAAATGAPVRLAESGEHRRPTAASERAAYRIVQEGLTNAYKHAPGAPVSVGLRWEPDSLVVEVANGPVLPGCSDFAAPVSGGQGLTGLRERARLAGGMLHSGPTPEGGFRLAGVLPYEPSRPVPGGMGRPAAATFGSGGDDLRDLSPVGAVQHRGHDIDGADPGGEFERIVRSYRARSRNRFLLGCGVLVLVLAGFLAALAFGLFTLREQTRTASAGGSAFDAVQVGQRESVVRARLLSAGAALPTGPTASLPPGPDGERCLDLAPASVQTAGADATTVFRFCFRDGRLVEKQVLEIDDRSTDRLEAG